MNFQESSQFPGVFIPVCLFQCHPYQSFQELTNHLKTVPNYMKFELKYTRNRAFFKESLYLPETLPALAEIELFWLKMTEKTSKERIFKDFPKNVSIIKESTFIIWMISIFEELLWKKPFFELVKL